MPRWFLHSLSGYPTPPSKANLRTIPRLAETFGCLVGLSDHSRSLAVPVAAVALGAVAVEVHVTLARADGGPDAAFSLEPAEMVELVRQARTAWEALGRPRSGPLPEEEASRRLRRSLYAVQDIRAGDC